MRKRTGFVIKIVGDAWKVTGRTEGEADQYPWSDPTFRAKFHNTGE